jgi:hypothetical protein
MPWLVLSEVPVERAAMIATIAEAIRVYGELD